MTAEAISAALGHAHRSGAGWRCRCPVHGSHGATLALRDGDRALIVNCFAGCDPRDVLAELRRLGLLDDGAEAPARAPDRAEIERRRAAEERDRQRRIALARDIIAASLPANGTPVERYLRTRGITIVPPAIRYVPMGDPYARHASGGRRPVMVAAVEHVEHGIVGVHRTWLAPDGSGKASLDPVRISTGPIGGGAVRLGGLRPGVPLVIAEGVEIGDVGNRAVRLAGMGGVVGWGHSPIGAAGYGARHCDRRRLRPLWDRRGGGPRRWTTMARRGGPPGAAGHS